MDLVRPLVPSLTLAEIAAEFELTILFVPAPAPASWGRGENIAKP